MQVSRLISYFIRRCFGGELAEAAVASDYTTILGLRDPNTQSDSQSHSRPTVRKLASQLCAPSPESTKICTAHPIGLAAVSSKTKPSFQRAGAI